MTTPQAPQQGPQENVPPASAYPQQGLVPPQWTPPPGWAQAPPAAAPKKKRRKWPYFVGALVLLIVVIAATSGGGDSTPAVPAAAPAGAAPAVEAPAAAAEPAAGDTVTYEVTGSGTAGNITYVKDSKMGMQQANGVKLPWKKDVTFDGGAFSFQPMTLTAQSGSGGSGEISCRITRNGEEVTSSTSSGPYAVVSCSGS